MKLRIPKEGAAKGRGPAVKGRCPLCGGKATFDWFTNIDDLTFGKTWLGQRKCPDPKCNAHIFYVKQDDTVVTYPPQHIDFEKTGLPSEVLSVLEEAIACHANECYIASAMMIRRTLEEVCAEKGAEGKYLVDRIKDLRSRIVLPEELFQAMDELRLLGNDAAHIESREYEKVSKEETEVGIQFAKEILKGVYQYGELLKSLRSLKKPPPSQPSP